MNSGKSQKVTFTNSFIILFQNEQETETVYYFNNTMAQLF
ncbi:DUF6943 family protein [Flavobacterium sp. ZB4P13]